MKEETKEKVASTSKMILGIVALAGFFVVAAVAGNAVQLLKYTPLMKKSKLKIYQINRHMKELLKRGFLEIKEDKNYKYISVTEKGKKLLIKYELEGLAQKKPSKWDRKYRLVIFDIKENKRGVRDRLRMIIRGFGFVQLQQSVWVYPYPCQDIIELLKEYLEIKTEVMYMTVDFIENDEWLKENFKLKK